MIKSEYILKHSTHTEELGFQSLKAQALKLVQDLAGKTWTDYNIHDPGITILEQLCYAITELAYKADFNVADFLTSKDGEIHFDELALHKPNEIFPSQAITINDYRKIIFDSVTGVVDVWVEEEKDLPITGLYNIYLRVRKAIFNDESEKRALIESVRQLYGENRNLGEDINEIIIVEPTYIKLNADLEIDSEIPPETIMAEIFFECSKMLNPGMVYHSFKEMIDGGMTLEEILTGPFTQNGYIKDSELYEKKERIYITDFIKVVSLVEGVRSMLNISMEMDGAEYYDQIILPNKKIGPSFDISGQLEDLSIKLYVKGRKHKVNIHEVITLYKKKIADYSAVKNTLQDINQLIQLPKGNYIDFGSYSSIQHDFPEIYGINKYGVPDSYPAKRKAQAKQLKSYLLLFEQLIANFLSQLKNTKQLFSINKSLDKSYFTQYLKDVPHIGGLYLKEEDKQVDAQLLNNLIKEHDQYYDRRNRLLDYLLALYGEKLSHNMLKQFNYYYTSEQFEDFLIQSKIQYLENLVNINKFKSKAYNYLSNNTNLNDVAGIKLKSIIQLGITSLTTKFVTDVFYKKGLLLSSEVDHNHIVFDLNSENAIVEGQIIESHFEDIPYKGSIQDLHFDIIYNYVKDERLIFDNIIAEELLRFGVNIENYLVGEFQDLGRYAIVIKNKDSEQWFFIKDFADKQDALDAANYLCAFFKHLNIESESFHLIEHIMFRPPIESLNYSFYLLDANGDRIFKSAVGFSAREREAVLNSLLGLLQDKCEYMISQKENGNYFIELALEELPICDGMQEFESKEEAIIKINSFCKYVASFKDKKDKDSLVEYYINTFNNLNITEDFYSSRVSVVLPNWTARFHNKNFRLWVEDTIRFNCPAHIYPEFYWLDIHKMKEFELLYNYFLQSKSGNNTNAHDLEDLAAQILGLLIDYSPNSTTYIV